MIYTITLGSIFWLVTSFCSYKFVLLFSWLLRSPLGTLKHGGDEGYHTPV